MRRGLMIAAIVVAIAIVAVLFIASRKPGTLEVRRSATIAAPPEKVYALIADFHNWPQWAPQDREDGTMVRTYQGAQQGVGAVSEWTASKSAGAGRAEVTAATAPARVEVTVDFRKPFVAHNVNEFVLQSAGAGTNVTWTMRGTNVFVAKVMSVFVNMDTMMGKHFEAGLSNLKNVAEK
jgi:uncharacterized protein YndB with AHSA1/START domain